MSAEPEPSFDAPTGSETTSQASRAGSARQTHFGLGDRAGAMLAGALGIGLLAMALRHAPIPVGSAIDAIAAVPTTLLGASAALVPVAEPAPIADSAVVAAPPVPDGPAETRWAARSADLLAVADGPSSALDGRLMRIYGLIAKSEAAAALEEARRLAGEYPDFGLAQLIYADLLVASTTPGREFASPAEPISNAGGERLRELLAEARARVAAAGQRPAPGLVPAQFVRLDPNIRHAVAVDIKRSRLYVIENTAHGLVVRRDYYASVGKLGMSKQVEGDLRTPLGVYFVTGRIPSARLHERYGATALSLNYPNQYDQLKGRTGSGIWLHGVETSVFTRPPLATDGCVALSNPDLLDLARFIERQETPVLIADEIQWVDGRTSQHRNAAFLDTFEAWRTARQTADLAAQARFYADPLEAVEGYAAVKPHPSTDRRTGTGRQATAQIGGVSMLTWHDQSNIMVVTYSEKPANAARGRMKRQYWREEGGAWQVLYEGTLG